jgi:hypothetical protein
VRSQSPLKIIYFTPPSHTPKKQSDHIKPCVMIFRQSTKNNGFFYDLSENKKESLLMTQVIVLLFRHQLPDAILKQLDQFLFLQPILPILLHLPTALLFFFVVLKINHDPSFHFAHSPNRLTTRTNHSLLLKCSPPPVTFFNYLVVHGTPPDEHDNLLFLPKR